MGRLGKIGAGVGLYAGGQAISGTLQGIGSAMGGAAHGAGAFAGGAAEGVGRAIAGTAQGIGAAVGGALQGAFTPADVVVNNIGIVGSAAQEKTTSTPIINSPTKPNAPTFNKKMPTDKLLGVAIKYLSSIENTLRNQLVFDKFLNTRQRAEERENMIESTGGSGLSGSGSGMLKAIREKTKKNSGALVKGIAIAGAAGAAALAVSSLADLDMSEFATTAADFSTRVTEAFNRLGVLAQLISVAATMYGVTQATKVFAGRSLAGAAGAAAGGAAAGKAGGMFSGIKAMFGFGPKAAPELAWNAKAGRWVTTNTHMPMFVSNAEAAAKGFVRPGAEKLLKPRTIGGFIKHLAKKGAPKFIVKKLAQFAARAGGVAGASVLAAPATGGFSLMMNIISLGLLAWATYDVVSFLWDAAYEYYGEDTTVESVPVPQDAIANAANPMAMVNMGMSMAGMGWGNAAVSGMPNMNTTVDYNGQGGGNSSSGNARADYIMNYLMNSVGLTKEQAAGFMGNLHAENDTYDPAREGPNTSKGRAIGIAQWLGSRRRDLEAFAKSRGKGVADLDTQLAFLKKELNGTHGHVLSALKKTNDVTQATDIVMRKFEVPSQAEMDKSWGKRVGFAKKMHGSATGGGALAGAAGAIGDMANSVVDGASSAASAVMEINYHERLQTMLQNIKENKYQLDIFGTQYKSFNNKLLEVEKKSREAEAREINGKNKTATSTNVVSVSPYEKDIRAASGGNLDVVNPNYKMSKDEIIVRYLSGFGVA